MAETIKKVITLNGTSMTNDTKNGTMSVYISEDQPMNISINLGTPDKVVANMTDVKADINTFLVQALTQAKSVAADMQPSGTSTSATTGSSTPKAQSEPASTDDGDNPAK